MRRMGTIRRGSGRPVAVAPALRLYRPGRLGPVGPRRRFRRFGLFGLLRGLFVLPLAAVLLAGGAGAALAHDDHDEAAAEEEAGAIMVQVGEDVAHDDHGATADTTEATAEEQAVVDALVAEAEATAERFAEIGDAEAAGYVSVPFKPVRGTDLLQTHALNPSYFRDERELDPEVPEGLMYVQFSDGEIALVALVFTSAVGEGPTPAGDLIVWHSHYVCTVNGEGMALPAGADTCPDGSPGRAPQREMLHLWVFDHPDGPFAHGFTPDAARVVSEAYDA